MWQRELGEGAKEGRPTRELRFRTTRLLSPSRYHMAPIAAFDAPHASIRTKINVNERAIFHFDRSDGSRESPVWRETLSRHLEVDSRIISARCGLADSYNYGKTKTLN